jgi:hypothetical protein
LIAGLVRRSGMYSSDGRNVPSWGFTFNRSPFDAVMLHEAVLLIMLLPNDDSIPEQS